MIHAKVVLMARRGRGQNRVAVSMRSARSIGLFTIEADTYSAQVRRHHPDCDNGGLLGTVGVLEALRRRSLREELSRCRISDQKDAYGAIDGLIRKGLRGNPGSGMTHYVAPPFSR